MSVFLEEVADEMVSRGLVAGKGADVFFDDMPDPAADPAICLYGGGGTGMHNSPAAARTVGVQVRGSNYAVTRAKGKAIYEDFHRTTNATMGDTRALYAIGGSMPRSVGPDRSGRAVVAFDMEMGTVSAHSVFDTGFLESALSISDTGGMVVLGGVGFSDISFPVISRTQITGYVTTSPEAGSTIMHYKIAANPGDPWAEVALSANNPHSGTAVALANGTQYRIGFSHDATWHTTYYLVTTGIADTGGSWHEE